MSQHPSRRSVLCTISAFGIGGIAPLRAAAQETYPARPVTIVTPFGAVVDSHARYLAQEFSKRLGGTFLVEQKFGAGGTIGINHVAKAKPDGYTLGVPGSGTLTSGVNLRQPPYDPAAFTFLGIIQTWNNFLLTGANSGINSIADLVSAARAKPGQLAFGSSGQGSTLHLTAEMFCQATGIKMIHVPYKDYAHVFPALMNGDLAFIFNSVQGAQELVKAGKMKALAYTGSRRVTHFPNVPTLAEQGVANVFAPPSFSALVGPPQMPPAITNRLIDAMRDIAASPSYLASISGTGIDPEGIFGDDLKKYLAEERGAWNNVIKKLGIKIES
jgi:tripartite-type tricarboxylate transporter receptor subunit TctC